MTPFELTAHHEAAHAVVGVYLGLRLRRVRLDPVGKKYDGFAYFMCPWSKRLQQGVMFAAGPAGDAICGVNDPEGWKVDFKEISELYFAKTERRILIDIATRYLRGPCAVAWKRVAERLVSRPISGREIKALLEHGEPIEDDP